MANIADRFGPYTCMRRLGAGGMAETFLAVQRGAAGYEQRVCMKFVLPEHRNDPSFTSLFLREATIAASLRHSNIVGVIDFHEADGYIVFELVDGVDLRALLNAAPNHALPAPIVTLIALELGKALSYAHARKRHGEPFGVVHRDISPSNILVSYSGEVKLTDFGIAKAIHHEVEPRSAAIKGKLCYMSPSSCATSRSTAAAILFSLGIVCYELLAGKRPFDGASDSDTVLRLSRGERLPLVEAAPDVPGGLALVIERLLHIDKDKRFQDADALIDALARFAPAAVVYRELGEFARSARPHETLSTGDLGKVAPEPAAQRRSNTPTLGMKVKAASPRISAPPPAPLGHAVDAPAVHASTARVSVRAWAALAASLLVLAGVGATWISRTQDTRDDAATRDTWDTRDTPDMPDTRNTEAEPPPASPPFAAEVHTNTVLTDTALAATPSPAASAPAADAGSTTQGDADAKDGGSSAPRKPAVSAAKHEAVASSSATQRDAGSDAEHEDVPARTSKPSGTLATLRVGTIPVGRIRIDGKIAGWSPVEVQLSPGRHLIAGGGETPSVRKELRLRAGERRQLVLTLDDSEEPATSSAKLR